MRCHPYIIILSTPIGQIVELEMYISNDNPIVRNTVNYRSYDIRNSTDDCQYLVFTLNDTKNVILHYMDIHTRIRYIMIVATF